VEILEDRNVWKADDAVSAQIQKFRALGIIGYCLICAMLGTVKLNNQFRTMADEIDDIPSHRRLTAEVKSAALEVAQSRPEDALRIRRGLPQGSGAWFCHPPTLA